MLTSSRISRNLGGNNTEMILQAFSDRILVLVTQMGKVGNLVVIFSQSCEYVSEGNLTDPSIHPSYCAAASATHRGPISARSSTSSVATSCNSTHSSSRKCTYRAHADIAFAICSPDCDHNLDCRIRRST